MAVLVSRGLYHEYMTNGHQYSERPSLRRRRRRRRPQRPDGGRLPRPGRPLDPGARARGTWSAAAASPRRSPPAAAPRPPPTSRACCGPRSSATSTSAAHGLRMVPCDPALLVPFPDGTGPALVGRPRPDGRGDRAALPRRREDLRPRGRGAEAPRPLPAAVLPRAPARPRARAASRACASSGGRPALARDHGRRDRRHGLLPDGKPRRLPRPQLRVGEGQDAHARQQPLRQARRALPAGHGARPAVPPALRRRAPGPGLLRPRDRRHGRDHAGDGLRGARARRRDPHGRAGGAHRRARRPGARRGPRGRDRDRGARRCSPTPIRSARSSASSRPRSCPRSSARKVAGIKMDGPCAKVNLVLSEEPRVSGMPRDWPISQRALFTLVPSLDFAERSYDAAKRGEIPEDLWVDCVVASNVDPSLAPRGPARHDLLRAVRALPPADGRLGRRARAAGRPRRRDDRPLRAERPGKRRGPPGRSRRSTSSGPTA